MRIINVTGRRSASIPAIKTPVVAARTKAATRESIKLAKSELEGKRVDKRHKIGAEEWATEEKWVNVHSSNVTAIKYDWEKGELYVRFGSSEYVYFGVAKNVAKMMFNTPSMGKFVHRVLRDRYQHRRLK